MPGHIVITGESAFSEHLLSHAHLCGEQASVWDVDGTGMQFVEDPDVDLGIRKARSVPLWWRAAELMLYIVSPDILSCYVWQKIAIPWTCMRICKCL